MLHTISVVTLRRVGYQQGFYRFWDASSPTVLQQQTTMAQFHNRSRYQEVLYDLYLWQCGMVFARVSSELEMSTVLFSYDIYDSCHL